MWAIGNVQFLAAWIPTISEADLAAALPNLGAKTIPQYLDNYRFLYQWALDHAGEARNLLG